MKRFSKLFALALLSGSFLIPTLNSCKTGENDPGISLRSRDSRLSATWSLGNFDFSRSTKTDYKAEYSSSDCGTEYDGTTDLTKLITNSQFEQQAEGSGDVGPDYDNRNEYGPTQFEKFSMEIAISKEGTYDVKMNLKLREENYYDGGQGGQGSGQWITKVFTESYEKTGLEWSWVRDGERKAKVRFQEFPFPDIDVESSLNQNNNYETYVDQLSINNSAQEFYIDKLKHKEMTLMMNTNTTDEEIDKREDYEVTDAQGNTVVCTETITKNMETKTELTIELTSNGDNIKE